MSNLTQRVTNLASYLVPFARFLPSQCNSLGCCCCCRCCCCCCLVSDGSFDSPDELAAKRSFTTTIVHYLAVGSGSREDQVLDAFAVVNFGWARLLEQANTSLPSTLPSTLLLLS